MRLPFTRPDLAFPELDGASEQQRRRLLAKARRSIDWRILLRALGPTLALLVWLVLLALGTLSILPALGAKPSAAHAITHPERTPAGVALLIGAGVGAALGVALWRDSLIYRALRAEIVRTRCRKCGHSLLGLPVHSSRGVGAPDPADAGVRCAECGRRIRLLDAGLTPRDLIPFEQRDVPRNFARLRTDARLGRRGSR